MVRPGLAENRSSTRTRRPSVLVVDDYESVREWMTRRLRFGEIEVHAAATGEDAIAIARREKLDLALIDYRLPGLNGVETASAIHELGISLPWVLFSSLEDPQAAESAAQRGALRAVWTPFDVYDVVRDALEVIARRRAADWARLLDSHRLPEPGTTLDYAAWWILQACTSDRDLPRIDPWVRFVRTTYSLLRNAYIRIGVEPHEARDVMRMLRALARTGGRVEQVEGQLALGDARTTSAMIAKAGLRQERPAEPIAIEYFLRHQEFVPAGHPLLDTLRTCRATGLLIPSRHEF